MTFKLLFFSDSVGLTTGYANIVRHMGRELVKRGVEVGYVGLQHPPMGKLWYDLDKDHRVPFYGGTPPGEVRAAVRDFKPDITLHVRDYIAHDERRIGGLAYKLRPYIETGKIWGWLPWQQAIAPVDHAECAWDQYDIALLFTEHGMREYGNIGFPRDKMRVLHSGISRSFSSPEGDALEWGRSEEKKKVPIALSIGVGSDPRKMWPMLIHAYSKVVNRVNVDFWLHTSAKGVYDHEAHIRAAGVPGHFVYPNVYANSQGDQLGWTEERLASLYRAAAAYISSGSGEGIDLPLAEASCMGLPVIFGDLPNRLEMLSDYEGTKVPVKSHLYPKTVDVEAMPDLDELAEAIARIPELKKNPEAGRKYHAAHTWEKTAGKFMEIAAKEGFS